MIGPFVKHRISAPFRWVFGKPSQASERQARSRRAARQDGPGCEALENRVVLSVGAGESLLSSLTYVGVVTSPVVTAPIHFFPMIPLASAVQSSQSSQFTQLNTDVKALVTELQTLAAKSGVTISDLESLSTDGQSIAQTPFQFSASTLNPVMSELAKAVAGGTSTTQAKSDFAALFSASVSTTLVSTTFNDLVTAIGASNVTTADLATVAADEAAIQTDLSNLPGPLHPGVAAASDIVNDLTVGVIQPLAPGGPPIGPGPHIITGPTPIIIGPTPIVIGPTPIAPVPWQGGSLFASLNYVGVVTNPVVVGGSGSPIVSASATGTTTPPSQLQSDVKALQTELQSLAATSGLTIADLQSLALDGQSITQAGFHFNLQKLNPVISELATAVAGGASTMQAQKDFNALFTGSKVTTAVMTSTFNDLVKAIQDSKVTTADLTTVASDEAAIKTDLGNLHTGTGKSGGTTGSGSSGSGSTGSGSTGTGSTGTGTTGTGTGTTGTGTTGTGTGTTGTGTGTTGTGTKGHKKIAPHARAHKSAAIVKVNAHDHIKATVRRTKG
jgi:hypothetical protein